MNWLGELISTDSFASSMIILGLVASIGLVISSIRIFNVKIGIAGVLFTGLVFGHFGLTINNELLDFVRNFGLVFFVYSIGMQVGPGFLAALRVQGLKLNLMALTIVVLGAVTALAASYLAGIDIPVVVGLLAGGTTNTASLGAAQEALKNLHGYTEQMGQMPGLGYAVAYPFGIFGVILTMILIRILFRINIKREVETSGYENDVEHSHLATMSIEVTNPNLDNLRVSEIPFIRESSVVISRIVKGDELIIAQGKTVINTGDILLIVGNQENLDKFLIGLGKEIEIDLSRFRSNSITRKIIVTKSRFIGRAVREIGFLQKHGVVITRIIRSGFEFAPTHKVQLHYGDRVIAVGAPDAIERISGLLGNSIKELSHPKLATMFIGIIAGLLLGSVPIRLPGVPEAVRLGIAGGPFIVALFVSWIARVGPLIWYIPKSANFMIREMGIALFLSCVGLKSGDRFIETLTQGDGLYWMAIASLITIIPILVVSFSARFFFKLNYTAICGLLAGSMTDPPALQFAVDSTESEAPYVIYATVYPLTVIMRIFLIQLIVIFFS